MVRRMPGIDFLAHLAIEPPKTRMGMIRAGMVEQPRGTFGKRGHLDRIVQVVTWHIDRCRRNSPRRVSRQYPRQQSPPHDRPQRSKQSEIPRIPIDRTILYHPQMKTGLSQGPIAHLHVTARQQVFRLAHGRRKIGPMKRTKLRIRFRQCSHPEIFSETAKPISPRNRKSPDEAGHYATWKSIGRCSPEKEILRDAVMPAPEIQQSSGPICHEFGASGGRPC